MKQLKKMVKQFQVYIDLNRSMQAPIAHGSLQSLPPKYERLNIN